MEGELRNVREEEECEYRKTNGGKGVDKDLNEQFGGNSGRRKGGETVRQVSE